MITKLLVIYLTSALLVDCITAAHFWNRSDGDIKIQSRCFHSVEKEEEEETSEDLNLHFSIEEKREIFGVVKFIS